jgi:phosphohistidine phosphatase SixA
MEQSRMPSPPKRLQAWRALLVVLPLLWAGLVQADEETWALLKKGGQVVLIRHGLTDPGVGDPPGFALDDCKTQRNLSDRGRQEAQRLGEAFRTRGIPFARVLSSPWCRCVETARIAFGVAQTNAALSNLFEHAQNRERQIAAFRELVAKAPPKSNLILVTHGSTTLAFTGVSPATAEMVVLTPSGNGQFRVAGRIPVADTPQPASQQGNTP